MKFSIVHVLACCILAPIFCLVFSYSAHKDDEANKKAGLVKPGMTRDQVREILGPPNQAAKWSKRALYDESWLYFVHSEVLSVDFDWEGHVATVYTQRRGW